MKIEELEAVGELVQLMKQTVRDLVKFKLSQIRVTGVAYRSDPDDVYLCTHIEITKQEVET